MRIQQLSHGILTVNAEHENCVACQKFSLKYFHEQLKICEICEIKDLHKFSAIRETKLSLCFLLYHSLCITGLCIHPFIQCGIQDTGDWWCVHENPHQGGSASLTHKCVHIQGFEGSINKNTQLAISLVSRLSLNCAPIKLTQRIRRVGLLSFIFYWSTGENQTS